MSQPSFFHNYHLPNPMQTSHFVNKRLHDDDSHDREKDFDIDNFLNVLEPYYKGGEYDYLLNSDKELDLLHKRFIVFELDNIKDHKILFPITTIIIMEVFINKMRKLKGIRKLILIEEAWLRHVSLVYDCLTFHSTRWK